MTMGWIAEKIFYAFVLVLQKTHVLHLVCHLSYDFLYLKCVH